MSDALQHILGNAFLAGLPLLLWWDIRRKRPRPVLWDLEWRC